MPKIPSVLDHYDDNGAFLRKVFEGKEVPEIIKTAVDLSSSLSRNNEDYALSVDTGRGVEHRFPIIDAGNTLSSALYFEEMGGDLPQELQKEAASALNIALVSFGFTPTENLVKTANLNFEIGYSGEGMETDRSLENLFGFDQKNDSMEVIKDAFGNVSPRGKRRLMLQVKEAGLLEHLSEEVVDYSRDQVGSDIGLGLDLRKLAVIDPEASIELDNLKKKSASADPEELVAALEAFDRSHKVTHLYGSIVPDPYATVYGTTIEKTASTEEAVSLFGKEYTSEQVNDFAEASLDSVSDAFGDSFANQFKDDPINVLSSLPVTHQKALARMIDGN
jgi:hypothetical protein